jgi:HD-GYP domain-containing protein (c-di-GMP phosphodiesterase class II)
MLKRIPVSQTRVGMHLHKLDGAWLSHPFWRTKFTITDPADLQRLQASEVPFVWIDVAQGLDVADPSTGAASPGPGVVAPPRPAPDGPAPVRPPAAAPQTLGDELQRAAAICKQGRQAVHQMFTEARLGKAVDAEHCLPVVAAITESVWRNPDALISLARLKTRDDYSYMHSVAVCALMVALSRTLGHDETTSREAGLAGLLHDLGKALMPLEVLNKPGKLTADEYATMQTHVLRGHEMLSEGQGAPAAALEVCLHHHERLDGRGYPHALAGEQLSLMARMGAVCDVYDAITSNRPYKAGWDPAESLATMASWQGQFDPDILQAFVRSLGIYPVGSMVRLASGKLAVVVEQNPGSLTAPVVKVFFSTRSNLPVTPVRLDLSRPGTQDRIVGRENPAQWGFPTLDELWVEGEVLRRAR